MWHFGPGVLHKAERLAEISHAEPTTIQWYDGLGVHLTSRGWLYNIAGRDAQGPFGAPACHHLKDLTSTT